MNVLLVLPVLIPLITAIACLAAWQYVRIQYWISAIGTVSLAVTGIVLLIQVRDSGIQVTQLGDWPAPFGISLVADLFSAIMILVTGILASIVAIYSIGSVDSNRESYGYYVLFQFLLLGVCGAFLTGDIFNLYVWFEVMLMSSFVLLALGGERRQLESSIKYVTLNLISSAIFLASIGILYGVVGTLNFADLSVKINQIDQPAVFTTVAMLFLIAFGVKAAIFPLFFWLPASYHTPPFAVSAIFAGLLTKVGVYSIIRLFTLLFLNDANYIHELLILIAGATMLTGIIGAIASQEIRRIFSFIIISGIGYMLMGLGVFSELSLAGTLFYLIHHMFVMTGLFLLAGIIFNVSGTSDLKHMGGLYRSYPLLAVLFIIPALSMAGIPPFSGFFGKVAIIRAGLEAHEYVVAAVALITGLLTLYVMMRIWSEAFWKSNPDQKKEYSSHTIDQKPFWGSPQVIGPVIAMVIFSIVIGFAAGPIFSLTEDAAFQLLHPEEYVTAVLMDSR